MSGDSKTEHEREGKGSSSLILSVKKGNIERLEVFIILVVLAYFTFEFIYKLIDGSLNIYRFGITFFGVLIFFIVVFAFRQVQKKFFEKQEIKENSKPLTQLKIFEDHLELINIRGGLKDSSNPSENLKKLNFDQVSKIILTAKPLSDLEIYCTNGQLYVLPITTKASGEMKAFGQKSAGMMMLEFCLDDYQESFDQGQEEYGSGIILILRDKTDIECEVENEMS